MRRIEEKILPDNFDAIRDGGKNFNLSLEEYAADPGDIVVLREWDPEMEEYTGRRMEKEVGYVQRSDDLDYGREELANKGFQIISFK